MEEKRRKIVIVATPTSPILSHLLHALSHNAGLEIKVLTRETSVTLFGVNGRSHNHHCESKTTHIQTPFSESQLGFHFQSADTVICCFTGSDIHLTHSIIDAASKAGTKLFIPSEYGLDTSDVKIRELLPPYQTRFEIQEKLRASGLNWKAIYSGVVLEDALKADGVLGIDVLWASVVVFPHKKEMKIAISTYRAIAKCIVEVVYREETRKGSEIYRCNFRASLEEIVAVVEEEIEKPLDRYKGDFDGAKKEAAERMKLGYFDGGVALLGRVAVWNDEVDAWNRWKDGSLKMKDDWKKEVIKVARIVRNGDIKGGGCGC